MEFIACNQLNSAESHNLGKSTIRKTVSMATDWLLSAMFVLSLPSTLSVPSPGNPHGILSSETGSVSSVCASQSLCLVTDLGVSAGTTGSGHNAENKDQKGLTTQNKMLCPPILKAYIFKKRKPFCSQTTKTQQWLCFLRPVSCCNLPEGIGLFLLRCQGVLQHANEQRRPPLSTLPLWLLLRDKVEVTQALRESEEEAFKTTTPP